MSKGEKKGQSDCKEIWSGWHSSTDKRLQPRFDAEAWRRAKAAVAQTIRSGISAPLGVFDAYKTARIVAGTPLAQKVDLRGVEKQMPEDMPGLIGALLGSGASNQGIAFGDSDHYFHGIKAMLADPKTIAAMRCTGVAFLFIECPPDDFARLLDDGNKSSQALLTRAACDAGITVVPIDLYGPGTRAYDTALKEFAVSHTDPDPQMKTIAMKHFTSALCELGPERIRVTNQVWVPRILEVLRSKPGARFIVLAGDEHLNNHVLVNTPDINYEDLNESLARQLGATIPYVRMAADRNAIRPRVERAAFDAATPGTPDLVIHVPSLDAQYIRQSPLGEKPERVQRQALAAYRMYDDTLKALTLEEFSLLSKEKAGRMNDDDLPLTKMLATALEDARNGHISEARTTMTGAEQRLAADYPVEGMSAALATPVQRMRRHLGKMRTALDALDDLFHGREPAENAPRLPGTLQPNSGLRLGIPARPAPRPFQRDTSPTVS